MAAVEACMSNHNVYTPQILQICRQVSQNANCGLYESSVEIMKALTGAWRLELTDLSCRQ